MAVFYKSRVRERIKKDNNLLQDLTITSTLLATWLLIVLNVKYFPSNE